MKYKLLLFLVLVIGIIPIQAQQNSFVLVDLQSNTSFTYKEVGTNNYIHYNITNRIRVRTGTHTGVYGVTEISNTTSSLNIIGEGANLTTIYNATTPKYILQFNSIINSSFINTQKGNMLINGTEYRYISAYDNSNNLLFTKIVKMYVFYEYADRAQSILTGNPAWDVYTLQITGANLFGIFKAKVEYDVSDSFNTNFQGSQITVKNITETFNFIQTWINVGNNKYEFNINSFQNVYVFSANQALPIYIEKFNSISSQPVLLNAKITQNYINQINFNAKKSFELNHYSWQKSKTKTTDFPFFFFILATFILVIKRKNKI